MGWFLIDSFQFQIVKVLCKGLEPPLRSNVRIGYKAFCQFKPIIRPEHPVYRQKLFSDDALISHLVLSLHRSPAGSESLERKTQYVTKNCVFAITKAYGCTGIEQSTVWPQHFPCVVNESAVHAGITGTLLSRLCLKMLAADSVCFCCFCLCNKILHSHIGP